MALNTDPSTILVTGTTGQHGSTGFYVAQRLREQGCAVRALVRQHSERTETLQKIGVDVVIGDFSNLPSLCNALKDVSQVSFTYPINGGIVEAAANFAAAIREAGNNPKVIVTSMAVADSRSPSHLARAQWLAEQVLTWSGINLRILRIAALFFENIPTLHGASIQQRNVIRNSFGDAKVPWISAADSAELVVSALLHPERYDEQVIQFPPGAEFLTYFEIASILSEVFKTPITYEAIAQGEWQRELELLAENGSSSPVNRDMAAHISTIGEALSRAGRAPVRMPDSIDLQKIIGRPPMFFREFLQRNRERFN